MCETRSTTSRNKYSNEFKDYIFWGKNPKSSNHNFTLSVTDKNAIRHVCNEISEIFKVETGIDLPFGKAQKLVNISFKYAYCLDDADKYLRKFYPCHMALDSVVLKWYAENKTDTVGVSNWSSIKYSDYIRIQNDIRQYCDQQKTLPLVKEFDVWLENM